MKKTKFEQHLLSSEKTLAVDFDGVIHDDNKGFFDGTIYGNPIFGTQEALKVLSKNYKIVIFSCKCNPERPLVDNKSGIELIWDWLRKWEMDLFISDVVFYKPNAFAYVDDKGLNFKSWKQVLRLINE